MKKILAILLMFLLLTGCGKPADPGENSSFSPEAPSAAAATEPTEAPWEWPVYEMEKVTVYDDNGIIVTVDAIHQEEDDPSRVFFTYTIINNNPFKIELVVYGSVLNGYSTPNGIINARVDPGETVTKDSRNSFKVPTGSDSVVVSFHTGELMNLSNFDFLDTNVTFTLCTTGADPDKTYTYPVGETVFYQEGVRIENIGRLGDESGLSMTFLIFNERENDLSMVVLDPTAINGIDVTGADSWVFREYYTSDIYAGTGYIFCLELSHDFLEEFPEIQRLESITAEVTVREYVKSWTDDLLCVPDVELAK